ncbi:MAG TPA: hypothetical protein VFV96_07885 [Verrucomicrobiae bacterium]|nr:hypothetical protein [Verrucomicrobiae bacterium]
MNALERIDRRLAAQTDAASHAWRLEILGRQMFGELWDENGPANPIGGHPGPSVVEESEL